MDSIPSPQSVGWTHTHDARLASLETGFTTLKDDVHSIRTAIADLAGQLSRSQKTDWSTLASWAAVVVAFIGLVGGIISWGLITNQNRTDEVLSKLSDSFVAHIRDGHPQRVEQKAANNAENIAKLDRELKSDIKYLDTTLQREMRQEDARILTSLEALDQRLQNEMGFRQEKIVVIVEELKRRMHEVEAWEKDHDKRVVGLNAAQWERIKALERKIFGQAESVTAN
jgi:hypothetical protein